MFFLKSCSYGGVNVGKLDFNHTNNSIIYTCLYALYIVSNYVSLF